MKAMTVVKSKAQLGVDVMRHMVEIATWELQAAWKVRAIVGFHGRSEDVCAEAKARLVRNAELKVVQLGVEDHNGIKD